MEKQNDKVPSSKGTFYFNFSSWEPDSIGKKRQGSEQKSTIFLSSNLATFERYSFWRSIQTQLYFYINMILKTLILTFKRNNLKKKT